MTNKKPKLTKATFLKEVRNFTPEYSKKDFPEMYGVTDGKAVGHSLNINLESF